MPPDEIVLNFVSNNDKEAVGSTTATWPLDPHN
jgi:hypothetical protein